MGEGTTITITERLAQLRGDTQSDLIRYVDEHGFESFDERPLSAVDALLFATLIYVPFQLLPEGEYTIRSAGEYLLSLRDLSKYILIKGDDLLLASCAESRRFSSIPLISFVSETDTEHDKQFSAGTFRYAEERYIVSYRGTDDSVVAWKEDFNMSFISPVPAQESAKLYLEERMEKLSGSFITTGHSKGGNLSLYAASFISEELQGRVEEVYSFDGPGFPERVLEEEGYKRMRSRMKLYVPRSSVVGMLLSRDLPYTAVESNAPTQILQHDPYTWLIDVSGAFITSQDTDEASKYVDHTVRATLEGMDDEERSALTDIIFNLAQSTGSETVSGIRKKPMESYAAIMKSYVELGKDERRRLHDSIGSLAGNALQSLSLLLKR